MSVVGLQKARKKKSTLGDVRELAGGRALVHVALVLWITFFGGAQLTRLYRSFAPSFICSNTLCSIAYFRSMLSAYGGLECHATRKRGVGARSARFQAM